MRADILLILVFLGFSHAIDQIGARVFSGCTPRIVVNLSYWSLDSGNFQYPYVMERPSRCFSISNRTNVRITRELRKHSLICLQAGRWDFFGQRVLHRYCRD
ncbi:hypothetical protein BGY98DRAFT_586813 [Russula aff. rugulosa BPL654]|nr:hypothetical protein BGY98DRAFT_586813 [Russula aff. rugulosa BPL654]